MTTWWAWLHMHSGLAGVCPLAYGTEEVVKMSRHRPFMVQSLVTSLTLLICVAVSSVLLSKPTTIVTIYS